MGTRTKTERATSEPGALSLDYERMLLIRRFEEAVQTHFLKGDIHGTTHLYNGQEAIAVGFARASREGDVVAATYRGHGHALARGVEPGGLAAELMGRATGTCGGRAGSMNVIDLDHGLLGCFGIVGGSIGAATGAALAFRGTERVAAAMFGDGTANQAYFAECLNFAQVLHLPVVFVCENNGYGEYTPWQAVTAGEDIAARASVYGIPARRLDGNDPEAVFEAASEAVERARSGAGPSFLEFETYRFVGHSRSDPGAYRPEGELDTRLKRDPLLLARLKLVERGVAEDDLDAIDADVKARVEEAFKAAAEAPFPEPQALRGASEYADG